MFWTSAEKRVSKDVFISAFHLLSVSVNFHNALYYCNSTLILNNIDISRVIYVMAYYKLASNNKYIYYLDYL